MHNKKLKKKGGGQILSTRLPHIVVASPNIRPYLEPLFFFLPILCCLFCRRALARCWRTLGRGKKKKHHIHTATKREREKR